MIDPRTANLFALLGPVLKDSRLSELRPTPRAGRGRTALKKLASLFATRSRPSADQRDDDTERSRTIGRAMVAYSRIEIASYVEVVTDQWPDELRTHALELLSHPDVQRHLEGHCPMPLVGHLLERLQGIRVVTVPEPEVRRASSVFCRLLELDRLLDDDDVRSLFRVLMDEQSSSALTEMIATCQDSNLVMQSLGRENERTTLDSVIAGLREYLLFCDRLHALLHDAAPIPGLAEAVYSHYAALFVEPPSGTSHAFHAVLDALERWDDVNPLARAAEVHRFRHVLEQLFSDAYVRHGEVLVREDLSASAAELALRRVEGAGTETLRKRDRLRPRSPLDIEAAGRRPHWLERAKSVGSAVQSARGRANRKKRRNTRIVIDARGGGSSSIVGKTYALTLMTQVSRRDVPLSRSISRFLGSRLRKTSVAALGAMPSAHSARSTLLFGRDFPRLSFAQEPETLRQGYLLFVGNLDAPRDHWLESLATSAPEAMRLLWGKCAGTVELNGTKRVKATQLSGYQYSAYPMASANDLRSAKRVADVLTNLAKESSHQDPVGFQRAYDRMLKELQGDLALLDAAPIVSLAAEEIQARRSGWAARDQARRPLADSPTLTSDVSESSAELRERQDA